MAQAVVGREEVSSFAHGAAVAEVLAGAWRAEPPPLRIPRETLEAIAPLLAASAAGGLAWHRLRATALRTSAAARELRQHYRLHTLRAVEREEAVCELLRRLRGAGVEPLLIKGWSSARLYPEPGLRPSCDVDLCVPRPQLAEAAAALAASALPCAVDLHGDIPDLPDRSWSEVFGRSRLATLGDVAVRVLGPEDQLRLLCLHLARHGVARPLWLCDVGACLEALPPEFDWDCCLWGDEYLSAWTECVLGLASRLLGSRTPTVPGWTGRVPPWVERAVLWCWGVGSGRPLRHYLRHPAEIVRRLRYHGISPRHGSAPIKASLQLRLPPLRGLPLLLVQLAAFVRRKVPHLLGRLGPCRRPRVCLPLSIHRH